jgi:predicted transcriptional regulator YheO
MTSKPVALLLADLGVTQSHSRPHVSNDCDAQGKRKHTVAQIAAEFGVTRPTVYRHLSKPAAGSTGPATSG